MVFECAQQAGADLGYLLGRGRRLRGGIFSRCGVGIFQRDANTSMKGRNAPYKAILCIACEGNGSIAHESIGWFLNDKKQHSYEGSLSASHVTHSGSQKLTCSDYRQKKNSGHHKE